MILMFCSSTRPSGALFFATMLRWPKRYSRKMSSDHASIGVSRTMVWLRGLGGEARDGRLGNRRRLDSGRRSPGCRQAAHRRRTSRPRVVGIADVSEDGEVRLCDERSPACTLAVDGARACCECETPWLPGIRSSSRPCSKKLSSHSREPERFLPMITMWRICGLYSRFRSICGSPLP